MYPPRHILLILAALTFAACGGNGSSTPANTGNGNTGGTGVVPKGARLMEIQVSEPASGDFAAAFNLAQTAGMDSASLSVDWNGVDIGTDNNTVPPTPIYASDPNTDFLAIANGCYPNSNTKLSLMLRPITTLTRMVPPGFENLAWDDPAMIDRFKAFIDHVFAKIPNLDIAAIAIGSEVDLHFADATTQQHGVTVVADRAQREHLVEGHLRAEQPARVSLRHAQVAPGSDGLQLVVGGLDLEAPPRRGQRLVETPALVVEGRVGLEQGEAVALFLAEAEQPAGREQEK